MNEQSPILQERKPRLKEGVVGLAQGLTARGGAGPEQASDPAQGSHHSRLRPLPSPPQGKAMQLGGRKNRTRAMAIGCLGVEPDSQAGADVPRATVPSLPLLG